MLTVLAKQVHRVRFLLNENSTTILTGLGVSGTVITAILTGRASFKAAEIINQQELEFNIESEKPGPDDLTIPSGTLNYHSLSRTDKVRLAWKFYLPPVGVGIFTITSIVMANKISSKQIAALTVAGGLSERAFQEYKEKVIQRLGENKDRDIRDEIAQDRVTNTPVGSREVILAGTGEVLCFDMTTGRYFQSTVEEIKRAENKVNRELINFQYASLSMFYEEIGLPPTSYSDAVGWNMDNHLEVLFTSTISSDSRPCIAIDFRRQPIPEYDRIPHG